MINTIHKIDKQLIKKWQVLWDESAESNIHNSPAWFIASCKAFNIQNYLVITIENNGKLEAIFPLVWEKRFGINALCNPGERFADKSSILLRAKNDEVLKILIKKLTKLGNLYLEEFSLQLANKILVTDPRLVKQRAAINPYLPLDSDPFQYMSAKNRSKMINKVKKNKEYLGYKTYAGDLQGLKIAFAIDSRSYKYEKGTSDIAGEREKNFYRELLKECKQNFVVDVISYKELPIIYSIGFIHKKTYHAGITSYDKDYAFLSPGKIMQYFLLKKLKDQQIEMFDFSRGINDFKKDFTQLTPYQYDILFSKHAGVIIWWKIANFIYNYIYEHKILYNSYLFFKRRLLK